MANIIPSTSNSSLSSLEGVELGPINQPQQGEPNPTQVLVHPPVSTITPPPVTPNPLDNSLATPPPFPHSVAAIRRPFNVPSTHWTPIKAPLVGGRPETPLTPILGKREDYDGDGSSGSETHNTTTESPVSDDEAKTHQQLMKNYQQLRKRLRKNPYPTFGDSGNNLTNFPPPPPPPPAGNPGVVA